MSVWFLLCLLTLVADAQSVVQVTRRGLIVDDQETSVFNTADGSSGACMNQREQNMLQALAKSAPNAGFHPPAASSTPCVEFETWMEPLPPNYVPTVAGGFGDVEKAAAKSTFRRFLRDTVRRVYGSYTVAIESLPEPGAYRVSFSPSPSIDLPQNWRTVSPGQLPVPQVMREGEELPIELDGGSSDGMRLVDYLRIGASDKMAQRKDAPRDSYAEDAEFALSQPSLRVNGMEAFTSSEAIHGSGVWLYAPGAGRVQLSFTPHPGFSRAGETAGNSMTLLLRGTVLRIQSQSRIAPGGGIYNVYAKPDADWKPEKPADKTRLLIGAAAGSNAPR